MTAHGNIGTKMVTKSRSMRPRALAAIVPAISGRALRRLGLREPGLLAAWSDIVGPVIAGASLPERLAFADGTRTEGVLHLWVEGAMAVEIQHLAPTIIARINAYFGHAAVQRLAITQRPLPKRRRSQLPRAPDPGPSAGASEDDPRFAGIDDAELRRSLTGLQRMLAQSAGRAE